MMTKLAAAEVAALDPYKFMPTLGKTHIHPGVPRRSPTSATSSWPARNHSKYHWTVPGPHRDEAN